ncbi:MAG: hypothetical protein K6G64_09095 [Eubacterium sp.]|nr:hypothetical protein [Eubacterium sp.]
MKLAIEFFSMIITITLGCLIFASVIHGNNQISEARDFYNVVVNRIEDSNGNPRVIEDCISEADKHGYQLTVRDVTVEEENPSKLVVMEYGVRMAIYEVFGNKYEKRAVIEGYAR